MEPTSAHGEYDITPAPAPAPRRRHGARVGTVALTLALVAGGATAATASPLWDQIAAPDTAPAAVPIALLAADTPAAGASEGGFLRPANAAGDDEDGGRHRRRGVAGTVVSVEAPSFSVGGPDGSSVKVTTDSSTRFFKTVEGSLADAAVGTKVIVAGTKAADGSLAAEGLDVLPGAAQETREAPDGPKRDGDGDRSHIRGQVASNDGSTLSVTTASGAVRVTTTSATKVTKTTAGSFSDVATGAAVMAGGDAAADGTITAERVNVGVRPAARPGPGPGPGGEGRKGDHTRGTVASVESPSFTVTQPDGSTTKVTTNGDTKLMKTVAATVADATVGSEIGAKGTRNADGSVTAEGIHIHPARPAGAEERPAPPEDRSQGDGERGMVHGTVASNDGSTLTVTTGSGTVTVTTSSATKVFKTSAATFADITRGAMVMAGGEAAADGTITARHVHIGAEGGPRPGGPGGGPDGGGRRGPESGQRQGGPEGGRREGGQRPGGPRGDGQGGQQQGGQQQGGTRPEAEGQPA